MTSLVNKRCRFELKVMKEKKKPVLDSCLQILNPKQTSYPLRKKQKGLYDGYYSAEKAVKTQTD